MFYEYIKKSLNLIHVFPAEYLKQTEDLFQLLTSQSDRERIDYELASTMLQQLQDTLTVKTADPIS